MPWNINIYSSIVVAVRRHSSPNAPISNGKCSTIWILYAICPLTISPSSNAHILIGFAASWGWVCVCLKVIQSVMKVIRSSNFIHRKHNACSVFRPAESTNFRIYFDFGRWIIGFWIYLLSASYERSAFGYLEWGDEEEMGGWSSGGGQSDLRAIWICYSVELIFVQCLSFVSLVVRNVIVAAADYINLFRALSLSRIVHFRY